MRSAPGPQERLCSALLAVALAVAGTATTALGLRTEDGVPPPVPVAADLGPPGPPAATAQPRKPRSSAAPRGLRRSLPARLEIPRIGVRTSLMTLGLRRDGTLEVPPLGADAPAGWFDRSPTPGELGASVIVGHVDSAREGPAVFYRLRELRPGDTLSVRRVDGSTARFTVTRVASFPKNDFPSAEVYGWRDFAGLQLITCGGGFDRSRRSYRNNIVVFTKLVP